MSVSTNINIAPFKAGHWTLPTIHGHTYLWFDVKAAVQYCPYVHALIFKESKMWANTAKYLMSNNLLNMVTVCECESS